MQDRVSATPGRMLITPENGQPAFYATVEMADNPTVEGTPLNKANLLTDATAALFGLGSEAVPDDLFILLAPSYLKALNSYVVSNEDETIIFRFNDAGFDFSKKYYVKVDIPETEGSASNVDGGMNARNYSSSESYAVKLSYKGNVTSSSVPEITLKSRSCFVHINFSNNNVNGLPVHVHLTSIASGTASAFQGAIFANKTSGIERVNLYDLPQGTIITLYEGGVYAN